MGSAVITTSPAAASHFVVTLPGNVAAGTAFTVTVTAVDAHGNTAVGYGGAVRFSSTDGAALLPGNGTLTGGVGTFSVTLNTSGNQSFSAADSVKAGITGSGTVSVSPLAAGHFVLSAPTSSLAGSVFAFTVTAEDTLGNTATGYTGTVHVRSSDSKAVLSADAVLTGGIGYFGAALLTAGRQTLTVTDTTNSGLNGTSAAITVNAEAASHFTVAAPALAVTGNSVAFTVTAEDPFNNTAAGYTGTVHFTSSDAAATLPTNATLTNGVGVFHATLQSPGSQTLTATDASAATITGTSNTVATRGLTVASLSPTATGFIATFDKPFDPSHISLYDANGVNGPDDVLLTGPGAPQISFHGSLIIDPSDQTITFVKTSNFNGPAFNPQTGVLTPGTYTVTFRSASNAFANALGTPLDGLNNGNPAGSNYVATFVVAATPVVTVGIPAFARGPDSLDPINLPNTAALGIPLNVSNGSGVTSGTFTLTYNSAMLSISGAAVNTTLPGASLSLDAASTPGTAILDFNSQTALASSTAAVRLGGLVATVPDSAASLYKSKALLHWSGVTVNGGAIAAVGEDSVEVVAYLGDAAGTANGSLSGGDTSDISAVATGTSTNATNGTLGGFSAFPLADPVIIAGLDSSGVVDGTDVTLLNSLLAGTPRTQIPTIPTNVAITVHGPDPLLSMPAALSGSLGGTVVVPVDIDTARPLGSTGANEAILALQYDPRLFSVSAADVRAGSLTDGWQLTTVVNSQTGQIGIDIFSSTPILTTQGGSLVEIVCSVLCAVGSAGVTGLSSPPIRLVNQVDPTGRRIFTTTVADGQGAFVLQFNNGQLSTPKNSMTSDETTADLRFTAHCSLPTAHFFDDTAHSQQPKAHYLDLALQEPALAQPAQVLNEEFAEQVPADNCGLTSLIDTPGASQTDWSSENYAAYLKQSVKHAVWTTEFGWVDDFTDEE